MNLAWDASADTSVTGYRVYYGTASGSYTKNVVTGNVTTGTVSGLTPGLTYFLAVRAYNAAGLESSLSNEVSYAVPLASNPPVVALTSPLYGATYMAPANVSLAANVTANGHTITKVQFYNGATLLGEDASSPYSFTWSSVGTGSYSLSAKVVYDAGSTVASSAAIVTITNVAPTVALTSPASGSAYTAPASVNLAASVTANGHTITKVQFYNGATLLGEDASSPYSFTWSSVGAGSYSLSVKVVYDAGSMVASSAAIVTITNVAPTVALTSPASGSAYTAPASVNLAASVTANGHTITKVQFYNGATLLGEDASSPYSFTWSSVGAGSYSLSAKVVYDAGSTVASSVVNVTVLTLAPTVALTSPLNGLTYTAPASISLAASITANGHTITKVQFYNGATLLGENASAPYGFTWSNVARGSYSLKARVVYDAGSARDSSLNNITVRGLPIPWRTADIGIVTAAGSAIESSGVYTVNGAGNINSTADNFRFAYQTLSGDGEIKARVQSLVATSTKGWAGVMIRESLATGSRGVFMGLRQDGTFRMKYRISTGGSTSGTSSGTGVLPNTWVRLVRTGDTLYGYKSTDGVNWTLVTSRTVTMATSINIGIAVASGSASLLDTATFTSVTAVP